MSAPPWSQDPPPALLPLLPPPPTLLSVPGPWSSRALASRPIQPTRLRVDRMRKQVRRQKERELREAITRAMNRGGPVILHHAPPRITFPPNVMDETRRFWKNDARPNMVITKRCEKPRRHLLWTRISRDYPEWTPGRCQVCGGTT